MNWYISMAAEAWNNWVSYDAAAPDRAGNRWPESLAPRSRSGFENHYAQIARLEQLSQLLGDQNAIELRGATERPEGRPMMSTDH